MPFGIGKRCETRRWQPLQVFHNASSSRAPSTSRCPNDIQPLPVTLPEKGMFATCSALTRHQQLQPGPARGFTGTHRHRCPSYLCRWGSSAEPSAHRRAGGHGASWSFPQRAARTPRTCTVLGCHGGGGMTWQDPDFFFWQVSHALTQKSQSGTCNTRRGAECTSGHEHAQPAKHSPALERGEGRAMLMCSEIMLF